jgi:hypothetical protein
MNRSWSFAASCLLASAAAAVGCSFAPSDARIGIDEPSFQAFTAGAPSSAADFLDKRCGSLDCHGNPQRNLQFWGCWGQRLPDADSSLPVVPGCRAAGGVNTTSLEFAASFRSLVGLEPAVMSTVVQNHGQDPDLLTYVRKARGEEAHKGGMLVSPGDPQDMCITAWLSGTSNTAACAQAMNLAP